MIAAESDCAAVACSALMAVMRECSTELHEHSDGVAGLALALGHRLGMGGRELRELERAARLHDLGKIVIDASLLSKPQPLTRREWREIRQHTLVGERMLRNVPGFARVARIVRSSHERWDGHGYPDGLCGEEIPLTARMLAVCDSFEAMTSDRPYRSAMSRTDAVDEMRRCEGTHFDPGIVGMFCALVGETEGALA